MNTAPPPVLDRRDEDQILKQLRKLAESHVPEWKGAPNLGPNADSLPPTIDAGTMLLRIFTRLMEITLERLNKVPEMNLYAFLNATGISLLPPVPARVPLRFALTSGSAPVRVPQGTRAGTIPKGEEQPVDFETIADLTVIPASLVAAWTMDPEWDRYGDHSAFINRSNGIGVLPLVGSRRLSHTLYLGDELLLNFNNAKVTVTFTKPAGLTLTTPLELDWHYMSNGQDTEVEAKTPTSNEIILDKVNAIDQTILKGPSEDSSLQQGLRSRWLRGTLKQPLDEDYRPEGLKLQNIQLEVSADNLLPDLAFSNTVAVDVTAPFYPFNKVPKVGDAFYLSCSEAFAKQHVDLELSFECKSSPGDTLKLIWEYFDGVIWKDTGADDRTKSFSKPELVILTLNPSVFSKSDLISLSAFVKKLRTEDDPVSRYLWSRFSVSTKDVLTDITSTPENQRLALVEALNDILKGVSIYETERFDTVALSSRTLALKSQRPKGVDLVRLNRLLLEDAYPLEIAKASVTSGNVNGKEGLWIRVRIHEGDYGKPDEYVPVDPDDLCKGYTLVPGDLNPPLITKLTLGYKASGTPHAIITENGFLLTDQKVANADANGFKPFVAIQNLPPVHADRDPSFYLGFDRTSPEEPITLFFAVAPRTFASASSTGSQSGGRIEAVPPSVHWEYFNGAGWLGLSVLDQTAHFMESGTVEFLTPRDIAPFAKFDLKQLYWIRATLPSEGGARNQDASELLKTPILSAIFLNTIPAVQAVTVANEIVGSGNSLPGQTFRLTQSPILADPEILVLEPELPSAVERKDMLRDEDPEGIEQRLEDLEAIQQRINPATSETEIWIRWHEVSSFYGSESHSRHYTLDHGTGELVFGDGVAGLIPALGTNNIVANYRVSAGSIGNVPKGAVAQLRSPPAGVESVTNPLSADGGADLETAEIVKRRGPQTLRHRGRALSRTDFEWLVREAVGTRLARVVCLPNTNRDFAFEPGWVTLVIVPQGTERRLVPSVELIRHVEESVSRRAFAGLDALNRINVVGPAYIEVVVAADIVLNDLRQASQVKQLVTEALDKFLHPLMGGPGGEGWALGRNVFASEIASVIQAVPGVDYLRDLQLIPSQAQHRIKLRPKVVFPQGLPDGSFLCSSDLRKSALLAEPVPAETEVISFDIKGFRVGDYVVRDQDDGFNPPFTIKSLGMDREEGTQLVGIEPSDFEFPKEGTLSTPGKRIKLPILRANSGLLSPLTRSLTLKDFKSGENVQLLLPNQEPISVSPSLTIGEVLPSSDVAYLGGMFLVCSGQHRITVSAPTLTVA